MNCDFRNIEKLNIPKLDFDVNHSSVAQRNLASSHPRRWKIIYLGFHIFPRLFSTALPRPPNNPYKVQVTHLNHDVKAIPTHEEHGIISETQSLDHGFATFILGLERFPNVLKRFACARSKKRVVIPYSWQIYFPKCTCIVCRILWLLTLFSLYEPTCAFWQCSSCPFMLLQH